KAYFQRVGGSQRRTGSESRAVGCRNCATRSADPVRAGQSAERGSMTRRGRFPLFIAALFFALLLTATSAQAAEEGANAATQHANEIFKWINFAIVAAAVGWLFVKKTPPFFRGNAEKISSAITTAT